MKQKRKPPAEMTFAEAVYALFQDGTDSHSIAELTQENEDVIVDHIHAERVKAKRK